jgi:hypothetical protein
MPVHLGVDTRLLLALDNRAADLAPDHHAARIGVIMFILELLAQLLGLDEDLVVVGIPDALVELRRAVRSRVRRLRRALHNRVVVDARVDQDAARPRALVESIDSEGLAGT